MAGRALALALLASLAAAQDHLYKPDAAWLALATEAWLVWMPDDDGASFDAKAGKEGGADPAPKFPTLTFKRVYVLQSVADPKQCRKAVVEWKTVQEMPLGLSPVTVREDGTLVLSPLDRRILFLCRPDGTTSSVPCVARDKSAALVAAYPDGVVLQAPPPDEIKPRGPEPGLKDSVLYWVAWDGNCLGSDKAHRMTFHDPVPTRFLLHVARFGDDVAMSDGVYSPRRRTRQRFPHGGAEISIYAFDGRVALGSTFACAVRESDDCGMVDDHEYFLARDGVGYWLEKGDGSEWAIRACRLRDRKMLVTLGHIRFWGELSPPRRVEGSTLADYDPTSKTRFTIYWTHEGLRWSGEDGWQSRAWLADADFK